MTRARKLRAKLAQNLRRAADQRALANDRGIAGIDSRNPPKPAATRTTAASGRRA